MRVPDHALPANRSAASSRPSRTLLSARRSPSTTLRAVGTKRRNGSRRSRTSSLSGSRRSSRRCACVLRVRWCEADARPQINAFYLEKEAEINRQELAALTLDTSAFDDGAEYIDPAHLYAFDLDVYGPRSLFPCLNRTCTQPGRTRRVRFEPTPGGTDCVTAPMSAVTLADGAYGQLGPRSRLCGNPRHSSHARASGGYNLSKRL